MDGGIRNVSPLGDIIKDINANDEPNTEYFVVIINNHTGVLQPFHKEKQNFLNVAYRSLVDITLNEIFINDIREFTRINSLVHQIDMAKVAGELNAFTLKNPKNKQVFRKFYYEIIQPDRPIGTTLDFSKEQITDRIAHGYERAEKVFGSSVPPTNGTTPIADHTPINPGPRFAAVDIPKRTVPKIHTWQV